MLFTLNKGFAQNLFLSKELYNHKDYVACYKSLQKNKVSIESEILKLKCLIQLDSIDLALHIAQKLYRVPIRNYELLGDAYKKAEKFDTAIILYQKANLISQKNSIQKKIQQLFNLKEVSKIQGNINLTNLGKSVNGLKNQFYPQLKHDTLLFYNDERFDLSHKIKKYNIVEGKVTTVKICLKDSIYKFTDIYLIGSSANSDYLLLNVLPKNIDFYTLKLCRYNINNNSITEISNLNEQLSKTFSLESSAHISNDGEQIVFSSNKKGGYGGYDIYMSKILPNGEYSIPKNLGPIINTEANEEFPQLSNDGKILYFSSDGHTSIGGYDLFLSELDTTQNNFKNVRNFGTDVNNLNDNFTICVNSTGRSGFTSGSYKGIENFGNNDIYELTFNNVTENMIVLVGQTNQQNINSIEVTKDGKDEMIGIYKINSTNGKFIAALAPGNYDFLFLTDSEEIKHKVSIPNYPNLSEITVDFNNLK